MSDKIVQYLQMLQQHESLTVEQAADVMTVLLSGDCPPEQVAAVLMGLSVKGETVAEVTGLADIMRQHMTTLALPQPLLDTCGTGGDGAHTFNISTATALVCAALGVPVVKHGNKGVSSRSGSADVLAALHIPTQLSAAAAEQYFKEHNFVFLLAPLFHPALKQFADLRKTLGVRTVFNILGPLLNPARPHYQLVGVADMSKAKLMGETLIALGAQHVVVAHSDDGLDEVSVAAATTVLEFRAQRPMERWRIEPEQFFALDSIQVSSAEESAHIIRQLAEGQGSAAAIAAVAMNAGLALYVADRAESYGAGRDLAEQFLRTNKLERYLRTL